MSLCLINLLLYLNVFFFNSYYPRLLTSMSVHFFKEMLLIPKLNVFFMSQSFCLKSNLFKTGFQHYEDEHCSWNVPWTQRSSKVNEGHKRSPLIVLLSYGQLLYLFSQCFINSSLEILMTLVIRLRQTVLLLYL